MEKRLAKQLLRCIQSPDERFPITETLKPFLQEYLTVGRRKGKSLYLSQEDKNVIASMLRVESIDPTTPPDAWDEITRSEALALGNHEKYASSPVRRRRVAVKALSPTAPLRLGQSPLYLPPRCHVEIDFDEVSVVDHDWLIVVENWEAFQDIHIAIQRLRFPGDNPLVIWRGDATTVRADAMLEWVERLIQPVSAFVDMDPSGLLIADALPRLKSVIYPGDDVLLQMLESHGLGRRDLYEAQIACAGEALRKSTHPDIARIFRTLEVTGKGLPQEHWTVPS